MQLEMEAAPSQAKDQAKYIVYLSLSQPDYIQRYIVFLSLMSAPYKVF